MFLPLSYFIILQNIGKIALNVVMPVIKNISPNITTIIELALIFFERIKINIIKLISGTILYLFFLMIRK